MLNAACLAKRNCACSKRPYSPPAEGREVLNDRGWSIEELKAFVRKSFPNHPLDLVDFKFARCIKGARQEMDIIRPTSVAELAREIKAGKIYIIPIKQLPYNPPDLLFVRFDSGRITLKDLNPGKDSESSKEQCVLSSYYEDISEDDTIFDLIEELDFSDTSQKFDSQSSKEEQSAENMETDANDQEDNISVITVSDEELCEDTTVGRSGTYVQTIMIFMRKRTNYINEEETGSTYDVINDYFEHFE
ncbi:unnamed protein product [Mytilus edulis]|uniref:Uncharacterized protein n=1 Tax=Mytilus edulis TaxID=6550 RepID=A0A8S3RQT7_MYTED|nr:unnamed protein product [Mytilus edulis]